jgi:hypothetical protein
MTQRARVVLDDCRGALLELTYGLQGAQWRRRWIACIVLLRAVGHVLEKVDAKASKAVCDAMNNEYLKLKQTQPNPQIYWNFIVDDRNLILKEYKFTAGQGIRAIGGKANYDEFGNLLDSKPGSIEYLYIINTGPFAGRRQHDLIQEAIDWWQDHLDKIDELSACC